jgi:hypothetical protein
MAVASNFDLVPGIVAIIAAVFLALADSAVTSRMRAFLLLSGHGQLS